MNIKNDQTTIPARSTMRSHDADAGRLFLVKYRPLDAVRVKKITVYSMIEHLFENWWGERDPNSYVQTIELSRIRNGSQTSLSCCRKGENVMVAVGYIVSKRKQTIEFSKADAAVIKHAADQCGQSLTEVVVCLGKLVQF
ncbi:hypothetical protein ACUSIJ_28770 [Pseudochelatococcus sp. B33]